MKKNVKIEIRIEETDKIALQKILFEKQLTISEFLRQYIKQFLKEENL